MSHTNDLIREYATEAALPLGSYTPSGLMHYMLGADQGGGLNVFGDPITTSPTWAEQISGWEAAASLFAISTTGKQLADVQHAVVTALAALT